MAALQQVIPYLTGADESTTTRPVLDQPVISALPNLFFVKRPLDIELDMNKVSVLKVRTSLQCAYKCAHAHTYTCTLFHRFNILNDA